MDYETRLDRAASIFWAAFGFQVGYLLIAKRFSPVATALVAGSGLYVWLEKRRSPEEEDDA